MFFVGTISLQVRNLNTYVICCFSGVGMKLTDVGIATCKKGWVCTFFVTKDTLRANCDFELTDLLMLFIFFVDTRDSKETVAPPS